MINIELPCSRKVINILFVIIFDKVKVIATIRNDTVNVSSEFKGYVCVGSGFLIRTRRIESQILRRCLTAAWWMRPWAPRAIASNSSPGKSMSPDTAACWRTRAFPEPFDPDELIWFPFLAPWWLLWAASLLCVKKGKCNIIWQACCNFIYRIYNTHTQSHLLCFVGSQILASTSEWSWSCGVWGYPWFWLGTRSDLGGGCLCRWLHCPSEQALFLHVIGWRLNELEIFFCTKGNRFFIFSI